MWWISLKSLALWEKVSGFTQRVLMHICRTWGLYMWLTYNSNPGDEVVVLAALGAFYTVYSITLVKLFPTCPLSRILIFLTQCRGFLKSFVSLRGCRSLRLRKTTALVICLPDTLKQCPGPLFTSTAERTKPLSETGLLYIIELFIRVSLFYDYI